MRNKALLPLMEQIIMVLVFALAAVLCLRVFLWSDARSVRQAARDQAVIRAESAAELLKRGSGDFAQAAATLGGEENGMSLSVGYDKDWNALRPGTEPAYILRARRENCSQPLLGQARVEVSDAKGGCLFALDVCWQEVAPCG